MIVPFNLNDRERCRARITRVVINAMPPTSSFPISLRALMPIRLLYSLCSQQVIRKSPFTCRPLDNFIRRPGKIPRDARLIYRVPSGVPIIGIVTQRSWRWIYSMVCHTVIRPRLPRRSMYGYSASCLVWQCRPWSRSSEVTPRSRRRCPKH